MSRSPAAGSAGLAGIAVGRAGGGSVELRAMGPAAGRLVSVRHAGRVGGPEPRLVDRPCRRAPRDGGPGRPRRAVGVLRATRERPKPRQAHRVRMIVYFIGLLVIASVLAVREYLFFIFLITGFFHATVLRPWPLVIVGVFATSVLVNTVIGGFPTNHGVVDDLGGDHRHPDARDRGRRAPRRADGRAERAAAPGGGPARDRARGERRPARPVADPGPRGRRARRAAAHGRRDPRHDRPGTDRGRHPARGGRAGRATGPRTGSGTSGTRSAWPATACRRRGDRSRARGPSGSRPPGCPMRSPTSPGSGRS